ncbi:hypothetical protein DFH09DRAFT_1355441 [Mycena vulgaris]|nr:hypothetical protein DFH09DRAFT_1355441 [Mycena vulgaris]
MPSYVITGAARGMGFEFVNQLSADGQNTLFALVRTKATATKLSALLRNNITILEADITDAAALKVAADEVSKATGGKLDYLINNAALLPGYSGFTLDKYPSPEAVEKDLLDNFKVNTIGVVHTTNAFLPLLRNGSTKKVITLSSGVADLEYTLLRGNPNQASYSISKAALNMVVAKYAAQFKDEGFTFLAISPGLVNTAVPRPTLQQLEALKQAIAKSVPDFKAPITPEESVKMQLEVINRWTVEDTGAFVSHYGNKQWL